jgi:hypothetical protein
MIRDYAATDIEAIKELHKAQGFDYALPDLSNPLFLVKKVKEVDGRVVAACFLRVTAEAFLVVGGSPVSKGRALKELQPEVEREAYEKGLAEYICAIPPEIVKDFAPTLRRIGLEQTRDWPIFQRNLL